MNSTLPAPKTKNLKVDVKATVPVEFGKNEKGYYTAKVTGLFDKNGNEIFFKNKDKAILGEKVAKAVTASLKAQFKNKFAAGSTGACNGSGGCSSN